ncbi:MAG: iron-sulfur cluster biosynthesis family protein [Schleiferilactobacillus harbinensis]
MKINIKDTARDYLSEKISPDQYVFLGLDDGSSKFSKLGGSCSVGGKFQLVLSDQPDADYTIPLENNAGYKMFTSKEETPYLENGLYLQFNNAALGLGSDGGLLDGAMRVTKADPSQITKADMEALGGKIC